MNHKAAVAILKNHGIDPKRLSVAMNMQYLCYDIGSMYSFEVERILKKGGMFKHKDKEILNKIKKEHQKLTNSLDRTLAEENLAEGFGELADFMQEGLELMAHIPDKNRGMILNFLKKYADYEGKEVS